LDVQIGMLQPMPRSVFGVPCELFLRGAWNSVRLQTRQTVT